MSTEDLEAALASLRASVTESRAISVEWPLLKPKKLLFFSLEVRSETGLQFKSHSLNAYMILQYFVFLQNVLQFEKIQNLFRKNVGKCICIEKEKKKFGSSKIFNVYFKEVSSAHSPINKK